jgi:glycosyltransferase involved in cell wall biosynthesis
MKICLVQLKVYAVFKPELQERFGGAEVQFYLLSRELAKDPSLEVTCISRDYGQTGGECIEGVKQQKVPQDHTGPKLWRDIHSALGLYRVMKEVDADIYLQRCAAVETGIMAHYCKRHNRPGVFFVANDPDVDGRFEQSAKPWVRAAYRYGLKNCSAIVCQNEGQQENLKNRFGREAPVIPSLCEVPGEYQAPQGDTVLWVSRCEERKGPEAFLEVAESFPGRKFIMVLSRGPDEEYFEKIVSAARRKENLELALNVPYREVEDYFSRAGVFVSTAAWEGFPNTFLQAMKFGIPLVSLAVDPRGVCKEHGAGLYAGGSLEKLREDLGRLFEDKGLYERTSRNAYNYVASHHNIQKRVKDYKNLFSRLLAAKSGREE